jgi:peroxiredoxin
LPSLENLHKIFYGKKFAVLGIDIQESRDLVLRQVQRQGLSYDNLLDENSEVSSLYGVRSTPTKFIIDTDGNLVGAALGYREWDGEGMQSLIRKLMEEGQ